MNKRFEIIVVDEFDNVIDVQEKVLVHQQGLLHRAFSVMLYRKINTTIEFLLQKRALSKYHCGGLWSNTCCSHPQLNDDIINSAKYRVKEELIDIDLDSLILNKIGSFIYKAEFNNGLIEHEYDHVFIGYYEDTPKIFNKDEIDELKWCDVNLIEHDYRLAPQNFTPWFYQVFELSKKHCT